MGGKYNDFVCQGYPHHSFYLGPPTSIPHFLDFWKGVKKTCRAQQEFFSLVCLIRICTYFPSSKKCTHASRYIIILCAHFLHIHIHFIIKKWIRFLRAFFPYSLSSEWWYNIFSWIESGQRQQKTTIFPTPSFFSVYFPGKCYCFSGVAVEQQKNIDFNCTVCPLL